MEPLYTAKTDYTPEVLERMNKKVLSRSKPFIIAIAIMAVLIVLFTAAWVHKIGAASIILGLILAAAFAGTFYFSVKSAIKKTYAYMQSNGRVHSEYRFFEDKLSEVSGAGTSEIEYKTLKAICETKTDYYFMFGAHGTLALQKENCPDGLAEFITKLKSEYGLKG